MATEHDGFDIISTIRSDQILVSSTDNTSINVHVESRAIGIPTPFYMFSYHQERIVASAKAFGWNTSGIEGPEGFSGLQILLHNHLTKKYNSRLYPSPLMLRIAFSAEGGFTITSHGPHPLPATIDEAPRPPNAGLASQLYPISLSTLVEPELHASYLRWQVFVSLNKVTPTLFTRHKTSNRVAYNNALALLPARPAGLGVNGLPLPIEVLIVNDRGEIMEGCRFTPYFRRGNNWVTPAAECGGNLGTTRRYALEKGLCEEGVIKAGSVQYNELIVLSNGAKGFQAGVVRPWTSLLSKSWLKS